MQRTRSDLWGRALTDVGSKHRHLLQQQCVAPIGPPRHDGSPRAIVDGGGDGDLRRRRQRQRFCCCLCGAGWMHNGGKSLAILLVLSTDVALACTLLAASCSCCALSVNRWRVSFSLGCAFADKFLPGWYLHCRLPATRQFHTACKRGTSANHRSARWLHRRPLYTPTSLYMPPTWLITLCCVSCCR
eukprot:COSAG01_NODE_10585_length_2128_cov_1.815673_2_plen_187_part_00